MKAAMVGVILGLAMVLVLFFMVAPGGHATWMG
jgi:hypothetical protein